MPMFLQTDIFLITIIKMKFEYNLIKLFSALPQDMIRAILEFDDTYHNTFRTEIFREQLLSLFWRQSFVEEAVSRMVFSKLETIVENRQTFMRPENAYVIMSGKFQSKFSYKTIVDMRKEIRVILSPYKNYMRWKLVPAREKLSRNPIVWDGCVGNLVHLRSDPSLFRSLFFGEGCVGGLLEMYGTPSEYGHLGDTFWF